MQLKVNTLGLEHKHVKHVTTRLTGWNLFPDMSQSKNSNKFNLEATLGSLYILLLNFKFLYFH